MIKTRKNEQLYFEDLKKPLNLLKSSLISYSEMEFVDRPVTEQGLGSSSPQPPPPFPPPHPISPPPPGVPQHQGAPQESVICNYISIKGHLQINIYNSITDKQKSISQL